MANKKICPNCNSEFPENFKFCKKCGTQLNEIIEPGAAIGDMNDMSGFNAMGNAGDMLNPVGDMNNAFNDGYAYYGGTGQEYMPDGNAYDNSYGYSNDAGQGYASLNSYDNSYEINVGNGYVPFNNAENSYEYTDFSQEVQNDQMPGAYEETYGDVNWQTQQDDSFGQESQPFAADTYNSDTIIAEPKTKILFGKNKKKSQPDDNNYVNLGPQQNINVDNNNSNNYTDTNRQQQTDSSTSNNYVNQLQQHQSDSNPAENYANQSTQQLQQQSQQQPQSQSDSSKNDYPNSTFLLQPEQPPRPKGNYKNNTNYVNHADNPIQSPQSLQSTQSSQPSSDSLDDIDYDDFKPQPGIIMPKIDDPDESKKNKKKQKDKQKEQKKQAGISKSSKPVKSVPLSDIDDEETAKKNRMLLIIGISAGVLLLVIIGCIAFFLLKGDGLFSSDDPDNKKITEADDDSDNDDDSDADDDTDEMFSGEASQDDSVIDTGTETEQQPTEPVQEEAPISFDVNDYVQAKESNIRIRSSADTSNTDNVIGRANENNVYRVVDPGDYNGFVKIRYGSSDAYISGDYVKPANEDDVRKTIETYRSYKKILNAYMTGSYDTGTGSTTPCSLDCGQEGLRYDSGESCFGVYDIDLDGMPELFIGRRDSTETSMFDRFNTFIFFPGDDIIEICKSNETRFRRGIRLFDTSSGSYVFFSSSEAADDAAAPCSMTFCARTGSTAGFEQKNAKSMTYNEMLSAENNKAYNRLAAIPMPLTPENAAAALSD